MKKSKKLNGIINVPGFVEKIIFWLKIIIIILSLIIFFIISILWFLFKFAFFKIKNLRGY